MPLYQLFCIAIHNPTSPVSPSHYSCIDVQAYLRQLVDGLARQVHTAGGVVREMRNLGVAKALPERMRANQEYHTHGE